MDGGSIYDRKIHVDIDLHSNLLEETNFSGFISNSGEDVLIANAYSAWTTIECNHDNASPTEHK